MEAENVFLSGLPDSLDESHLSRNEDCRVNLLHKELNRAPLRSNVSDTFDQRKQEEKLSERNNNLAVSVEEFSSVSIQQEMQSPQQNEEAIEVIKFDSSMFNNTVNQSPAQLEDTSTTKELHFASVAINQERISPLSSEIKPTSICIEQEMQSSQQNEQVVELIGLASSMFNNEVNRLPAQHEDMRTIKEFNCAPVAIKNECKSQLPTEAISSLTKQEIQSPRQNEDITDRPLMGLAWSMEQEDDLLFPMDCKVTSHQEFALLESHNMLNESNKKRIGSSNQSERNCDDQPNTEKLETVIGALDGTSTNGFLMYFCNKLKKVCNKPFHIVKMYISRADSDIYRYCGLLSTILYDGMRVLLTSHDYVSEMKELNVKMTVKLNSEKTPTITFHVMKTTASGTKEAAEIDSLKEDELNRREHIYMKKPSIAYGIVTDSSHQGPMHAIPTSVSCFKDGNVKHCRVLKKGVHLNGTKLKYCCITFDRLCDIGDVVEVKNIVLTKSGYHSEININLDLNALNEKCSLEEHSNLKGVIEALTMFRMVLVPAEVSVYINCVKRRVRVGIDQLLFKGSSIKGVKRKTLMEVSFKVGDVVELKTICSYNRKRFDYIGLIEIDRNLFYSQKQCNCDSGSPSQPIIQGKVATKVSTSCERQKKITVSEVDETLTGTIVFVRLYREVHLPEIVRICFNNVMKMVLIKRREIFIGNEQIMKSHLSKMPKDYFKVGDSIIIHKTWTFSVPRDYDFWGMIEIDPSLLDSCKEPNCSTQPSHHKYLRVSTITRPENQEQTVVSNKLIGIIETVRLMKIIYLPVEVRIYIDNIMKRVYINRNAFRLNKKTVTNSQLKKLPTKYFKVGDTIELSKIGSRGMPVGYDFYGTINMDRILCDVTSNQPYCSNSNPTSTNSLGSSTKMCATVSSTELPNRASHVNDFARNYGSRTDWIVQPGFANSSATQTSSVQASASVDLPSNIRSGGYIHKESQHLSQNVSWSTRTFCNINTITVGGDAACQRSDVLSQPWNTNNYAGYEANLRSEEHQTSRQPWNTTDSVYNLTDIRQQDNQRHRTGNDNSDLQLSTRYLHNASKVYQTPECSRLSESKRQVYFIKEYNKTSMIVHANGFAVSQAMGNSLGHASASSQLGGEAIKREPELHHVYSLPDNAHVPYSFVTATNLPDTATPRPNTLDCTSINNPQLQNVVSKTFTGVVVQKQKKSGVAQFELNGSFEMARFYRANITQDGMLCVQGMADLLIGSEVILRFVRPALRKKDYSNGIAYTAHVEIQGHKKRKATTEDEGESSTKRFKNNEEAYFLGIITKLERSKQGFDLPRVVDWNNNQTWIRRDMTLNHLPMKNFQELPPGVQFRLGDTLKITRLAKLKSAKKINCTFSASVYM